MYSPNRPELLGWGLNFEVVFASVCAVVWVFLCVCVSDISKPSRWKVKAANFRKVSTYKSFRLWSGRGRRLSASTLFVCLKYSCRRTRGREINVHNSSRKIRNLETNKYGPIVEWGSVNFWFVWSGNADFWDWSRPPARTFLNVFLEGSQSSVGGAVKNNSGARADLKRYFMRGDQIFLGPISPTWPAISS